MEDKPNLKKTFDIDEEDRKLLAQIRNWNKRNS